jgi:hypothetical protein
MRGLVAAIAVAVIALSLTACSGSSTSSTASVSTPTAGSNAPKPPAYSKTNLLSPSEPGTGVPFPVDRQTPKVTNEHMSDHKPMLVFFYDPKQPTTVDQRTEIYAAMKGYRGLIDLVTFDVTGALPDAVTSRASTRTIDQQVALLVQDLQIGFTPYVILVNKDGIMTARYRGFVDRALLDREILRATQ